MEKRISLEDLIKNYTSTYNIISADDLFKGDDIKNLRASMNMTQSYFARIINVSKKTIEKWEQGANPVQGAAAVLIHLIKEQPTLITKIVQDSDMVVDQNANLVYMRRDDGNVITKAETWEAEPIKNKDNDQKQIYAFA